MRQDSIKAIFDLVRPAFHRAYDAVEANLAGSGVSVPQRGLLQLLLEAGPQTVPAMAQRLLVKRQFALRLANELEALQLIGRMANPAHKRSDVFALTETGRTFIAGILEQEAEACARVLSGLGEADLAAAARVLSVIAKGDFGAGRR